MISMQLAALVLAVAGNGGGETVLLDFHADWCGPCRSMEPAVAQMIAAGYPIKKVNVDHERALAAKYHVQAIPCFVLLINGQEVDRLEGATGAGELQGLFAKARRQRDAGQTPAQLARGQSPDSPPTTPATTRSGGQTCTVPTAYREPATGGQAAAAATPGAAARATVPVATLLESSVRLTIEDRDGFSYGSGTIIDSRHGEALVLTCGHIFRDSQGQGKITVDVFGRQPAQKLAGRLVSYDLKRDVGLVSIHTPGPVTVARVAPKGHRLTVGEPVVSIGCNNGANPTPRDSKVTSLDKFLGPANVQVAGQPVQGRSGGGLFNQEGLVVGVCNAADPTDNEGLFAAAATIQEELDRSNLMALYQAPAGGAGGFVPNPEPAAPLAAVPSRATAATPSSADLRAAADASALQRLNPSERAALTEVGARAQGAEVICIVRSLADPQGKSDIVVLDRASPAFLERLAAEQTTQGARHLTSLEVPRQAQSTTNQSTQR